MPSQRKTRSQTAPTAAASEAHKTKETAEPITHQYLDATDEVDGKEAGAGVGTAGTAHHAAQQGLSSRKGKRKSQDEIEAGESGAESNEGDARGESSSMETKRQKKLPVRVKDLDLQPGHSRIEIEIPIPAKKLRSNKTIPAIEEAASDHEDGDDKFVTPAVKRSSHVRFDGDDNDNNSEQFYTPLEAPAKRNAQHASTPRPETVPEEEEEEEDSDDDAPPEAVSFTTAKGETLKSGQTAAKAAELQAAAQKRKRQERDALFKAQAEARKRAVVSARPGGDEAAANMNVSSSSSKKRQRAAKSDVPALLPAELLESDDEDEDDDSDTSQGSESRRRPKKIKFSTAVRDLDRQHRPPQDQRAGSTLYRVIKDRGNVGLAPKARKVAQSLKRDMLARSRVGTKVSSTRGFLVRRR